MNNEKTGYVEIDYTLPDGNRECIVVGISLLGETIAQLRVDKCTCIMIMKFDYNEG